MVAVCGEWLSSNLGTGSPLEPHFRSEMEEKFGEDFSNVRIHTEDKGDLVAKTLNARAVTVGQHIAFAHGEYNPYTQTGRNLFIHELVHTVQQKGVNGIPSSYIPITRPLDRSEHEANYVTQAISNGRYSQPTRSPIMASSVQVNLSVCSAHCNGICWASFTALCAAIAALCTAGSVITFGGLAIPCTPLVIGTCALAAYDASMCSDLLCPEICGETETEAVPTS